MKQTSASYEGKHIVILPEGLTGTVTLEDGSTYDLGPGDHTVVEVDSHDHGKEVGLLASQLAHEDESLPDVTHDESLSRKNLGLKKGK